MVKNESQCGRKEINLQNLVCNWVEAFQLSVSNHNRRNFLETFKPTNVDFEAGDGQKKLRYHSDILPAQGHDNPKEQ